MLHSECAFKTASYTVYSTYKTGRTQPFNLCFPWSSKQHSRVFSWLYTCTFPGKYFLVILILLGQLVNILGTRVKFKLILGYFFFRFKTHLEKKQQFWAFVSHLAWISHLSRYFRDKKWKWWRHNLFSF